MKLLMFIQKMLLLLFFCGLFCASHTSTIREKRQISIHENSTELNDGQGVADRKNKEDVVLLVNILKHLGAEYLEDKEYSLDEEAQNLLTEMKDVWQRLVNSSKPLTNTGESPESLTTYWAHILFIAGERHCESPKETFFEGKCLPIITESISEHCPENMGLYDDDINEGFCGCVELSGEKANSELSLIYSDVTGSCHQQNTQGPCEDGQWFVRKDTPQCEPVPDGCPADGKHVYWSPESSTAKQCWEVWTQGPCKKMGELIHLTQDMEELKIYCSHRFSNSIFQHSLPNWGRCPKGYSLNRHEQKCIKTNWMFG